VLSIRGRLGDELTVAEGQASAPLVAINLLARARAVPGGLDAVSSVVRLVGYVNAAPGFVEAPSVLDGAFSALRLVDSVTTTTGVVIGTYEPADDSGSAPES
jgi:hypothetical protein